MKTEDADEDIREWVQENRDLIADVLRNGDDPFARACALVALKHGGTDRDVEAIKQEVEKVC